MYFNKSKPKRSCSGTGFKAVNSRQRSSSSGTMKSVTTAMGNHALFTQEFANTLIFQFTVRAHLSELKLNQAPRLFNHHLKELGKGTQTVLKDLHCCYSRRWSSLCLLALIQYIPYSAALGSEKTSTSDYGMVNILQTCEFKKSALHSNGQK